VLLILEDQKAAICKLTAKLVQALDETSGKRKCFVTFLQPHLKLSSKIIEEN